MPVNNSSNSSPTSSSSSSSSSSVPFPYTTETLARAIQFALDLPTTPVLTPLADSKLGCDTKAYFVGTSQTLILRVGRSAAEDDESAVKLQNDITARELVRKHLRAATADSSSANDDSTTLELREDIIPRCVASGTLSSPSSDAQEDKRPFCIDERMSGCTLDEARANERTESDLVSLMRVLKGISLDEVRGSICEIESESESDEEDDSDSLTDGAQEAYERLRERGQLPSLLLGSMEVPTHEAIEAARNKIRDGPVLLHADLKGEHVFVDAESGRVTGVIDWADVKIGPPYEDVHGLAECVGARMAASIAARVGYNEATVECGIFSAQCNVLTSLDDELNGDGDDSPIELLKVQLKRVFETWRSGILD